MPREYETKVLDINVRRVHSQLIAIGAKASRERLMRRWVYDINPKAAEWVRLRDDGTKTTITYKRKSGHGIHQTLELEVEVADFEKTAAILARLGFKHTYYQENRRRSYTLEGIEFCIDSWPRLPALLEVESSSVAKVTKGLRMLGLQGKDIGNITVKDVYTHYGIDLHKIPALRF